MQQLKIFLLDNNQLNHVAEELFELKSLQVLSLSCNRLKRISHNVRNLTNIVKLDISNNQIEFIPKSLEKLVKMDYLSISNNNYTTIPCSILALLNRNLKHFEFEWVHYIPTRKKVTSTTLLQLHEALVKYKIDQCALTTFLDYFSENITDPFMLHKAVMKGHHGVVAGLLLGNFYPNNKDQNGYTPLSLAIKFDQVQIATIILKHPTCDKNIGAGKYGTILHLALLKRKPSLLMQMLKFGNMDPDILDNNGNTVLHHIIKYYYNKTQL